MTHVPMERLLAFFLRQRDKAIGNSTQLEVFMSHLKSLTAVAVICLLQSGPSTILVWTLKEKINGQETRA